MASNNYSNMTPRQKMINLMYIVLTAMLALNVSTDVLEGFRQVEDSLARSTDNASEQNKALYGELTDYNITNPEKSGEWYSKATNVRNRTEGLVNFIDSLKIAIVKQADGRDGDINNIKRMDDLEAASHIMLSPAKGQGEKLRKSLIEYADFVTPMVNDSIKRKVISEYLYPVARNKEGLIKNKTWEEESFEGMPVAAAITVLTKLQNDIRYAESEILHILRNNIDEGDVRVNRMDAYVIPASKTVMRGSSYSANIVLAAVDTTQVPTIYIGDKELEKEKNGLYEFICNQTGVFDYSGYLEVSAGDGSILRHPFTSSYTVIEPSATVSATMMNVLYAGIENPISISVPGIPNNAISATMTNGTLTRSGDGWIAKPKSVGQDVTISVTANMEGRTQTVSQTVFRVRQLPDPMPFITYTDDKGNPQRYRGGKPISKALLVKAPGIEAAIDDGLLNISFKVLSFETVIFDSMGNAMPEVSNGAQFSDRQKAAIKKLSRGKRFYISKVKAIGPDGIERTISPIEVFVN